MTIQNSELRSTIRGVAIQESMHDYLITQHFTHMITITANTEYTADKMGKMVEHWLNDCISRMFRAKRYQHKVKCCGFLEFNMMGHLHWHLLFDLPLDRVGWFERTGGRLWDKQVKSGTFDIRPIDNLVSAVDYVTKGLSCSFSYERYLPLSYLVA